MKKLLITLSIIVIIIIGLEIGGILPLTLVPMIIEAHDRMKSNPHVLVFITNMRTFISSIEIQPFLNRIDLMILETIDILSSLPWEKINIWYVLGVIFVIGVISEKFRVINNDIKFLRQKNVKLEKEILSSVDTQSSVNSLQQRASEIRDILNELKKTSDLLRSTLLRSKKLRRDPQTDYSVTEHSGISKDIESDETANISSKTSNDSSEKENLETNDEKKQVNQIEKLDVGILDDDISSLDLARTYIESDENDKATNIIMNVIKTGNEQEKHEARLLYMQLRK